MDRLRPAGAHVLFRDVPGDAGPPCLLLDEMPGGVGGPHDAVDSPDGGSEALLADVQAALHPALVERGGHHRQEQDQEGDAGHRQGDVPLAGRQGGHVRGVSAGLLCGEGRRRHACVMHPGDRQAHHTGGGELLPGPVASKCEPQGGGGGGNRDGDRDGDDRRVVGEVAGHPHCRHAGVVHRRHADTHEWARDQQGPRAGASASHPGEGGGGHADGDQQRQECQAEVVCGGQPHLEGEHADEVHRPDAPAHRHRRARSPGPARTDVRPAHPRAEVERCVGREHRDDDGERDEERIVSGVNHGTSGVCTRSVPPNGSDLGALAHS